MINPFIIKKYGALLGAGLITCIAFFTGFIFYGLLAGLGAMILGLFLALIMGNILLDNPFRSMLEGNGVLFFDISSTGIIRPFILRVKPPYVEGMLDGKLAQDVFDREMVYNLAVPQEAGEIQQGMGQDGKIRTAIVIEEEEYNRGRFGFFHYPAVLWNSQINSVLTKDWLSEQEKTSFAEHQVLYLNRKVEELTTAMLNFGRYVVESTKPKWLNISKGWVVVIIIVFVVILLILLAPALIPALKQALGGVSSAAGNAAGAVGSVSPR